MFSTGDYVKVLHVVGARPNFMKAAALIPEMAKHPEFQSTLVHTGQHYDYGLSDVFFKELGLPKPDVHLGIGSGSHAEQTAKVMLALEPLLKERRPDLVMVVGDINSTLAAALTASKLHIPVAHVEAGLRSHDPRMPEEVNRVLTDHMSQYLLTSSPEAEKNLKKEGIRDGVFFVGNTMIDTLMKFRREAEKSQVLEKLGVEPGEYGLVTLHRPENVDTKAQLDLLLGHLELAATFAPLLFPIHPRTRARLEEFGLSNRVKNNPRLRLIEPQGYLEFLKLQSHAKFVITDSGGVQEETTVLGVPCLTMRENTERPITISHGTNTLVGFDRTKILAALNAIVSGEYKHGKGKTKPPRWDGKAAERICQVLLKHPPGSSH